MTVTRLLLWLLFSAGGVLIGFGMAFAAASVVAVLVPHCGIGCDDTVPELLAAAAAYGTWFVTAVATSVLAWRELARR